MPARRRVRPVVALLVVACLGAGCGGSTKEPGASSRPTPQRASQVAGEVHILFLGNSHTQRHDVPATVAALLEAGRRPVHVEVATAPGLMHLDERATDEPTLELLRSRDWDVVVMQAQNYSLSGTTDYPNDGSVSLVRNVRKSGGLPVLYAEWPRRGIDETDIILEAYDAIARQEPACLPPVPETFDHAIAEDPELDRTLIDTDGNHATPAGAFLAALVLSAAIGEEDVASLPAVPVPDVPADLQRRLRTLAAQELERIPASRGCPAVE